MRDRGREVGGEGQRGRECGMEWAVGGGEYVGLELALGCGMMGCENRH